MKAEHLRIFKHAKNHIPVFSCVSLLAAERSQSHDYVSSSFILTQYCQCAPGVTLHEQCYMVFLYLALRTNSSKHGVGTYVSQAPLECEYAKCLICSCLTLHKNLLDKCYESVHFSGWRDKKREWRRWLEPPEPKPDHPATVIQEHCSRDRKRCYTIYTFVLWRAENTHLTFNLVLQQRQLPLHLWARQVLSRTRCYLFFFQVSCFGHRLP